jgi:uncharacterized membrane protein
MMERARLEAFSDGVMAVAITLLALDLAVAGPGHGPLIDQLAHRWPSYVAYLISFFMIGIIWVNHHVIFGNIARVERMLLFLNLLLLLFIVAIPFATATMAQYLTIGGTDSKVAMVLYAAVFEGMGLSFALIFVWSLGDGRSIHAVPAERRRAAFLRFSIGNLPYLVSIGIAFVSPPLALAIIALVAVYYIFERTPPRADGETSSGTST